MKVGEHGQVTVPRELRRKFGLAPGTEVEFTVVQGHLVLRKKAAHRADFSEWAGRCRKSFDEMEYANVDDFIEDIRGR
jgi:AbrB family looped-hinge helix DNA binding protein